MIIKASQRGGAEQMALHLLNGGMNEHVTLHEIRNFVAQNVRGALNEAYGLSKGTKCKQFMFSLSLNPPSGEAVPVPVFEDALERIEKKLGLEDQPRVVVFHEKEARRHAHAVYSRIDAEEMKAINLPHYKNKLMAVSKSIYLDMGWQLPKGFIDKNLKSPLNYTRQEWQQALRTGQSPKVIKAALQESWAVSDCRKSLEQALSERGYFLARGDRRGHVAVDVYGQVYALPRQLGLKAKEVKARLGDPKDLPSVADTKAKIAGQIEGLFNGYRGELDKSHRKDLEPLLQIKAAMTKAHRLERAAQKAFQDKRWQIEENKRAARLRKGLRGVWDKLTGKYWKLRKRNEREAWQVHVRDQNERQDLIERQLEQRGALQRQFEDLREKHEQDRAALTRELAHITELQKTDKLYRPEPEKSQERDKTHDYALSKNTPDLDPDLEPEI